MMKNQSVNIVDCTIRDGGIMNNWQFTFETVRQMLIANTKAQVEYMECGYRCNKDMFSPADYGRWKFCNEDDMKRVIDGIDTNIKFSVMVDIGRCLESDILPKEKSIFHTTRLACYVHQADETLKMAQHCIASGYETFINIMAVSIAPMQTIINFLQRIQEIDVKGVYVSDTFGSFTIHQAEELVRLYKTICPTKVIGFHGHNNQQMALANTLLAMNSGATFLDGTYFGMGRGAGNCPLELLLPQVSKEKYDVRALLPVIEEYIEPIQSEYKWGYRIPYALTGITNQHPRSAISFINDNRSGYDSLYEDLVLDN
jgi:4-hydroxy 2-oxovalerate aldolase